MLKTQKAQNINTLNLSEIQSEYKILSYVKIVEICHREMRQNHWFVYSMWFKVTYSNIREYEKQKNWSPPVSERLGLGLGHQSLNVKQHHLSKFKFLSETEKWHHSSFG